MPASSVSALNSWGVYLAASLVLLALLSPALVSAARTSRAGADFREVDGVSAVLSSLAPGMTVTFSFGYGPGADPLVLTPTSIVCSYGPGNVSAASPWALPATTLFPGVRYAASLEGGTVRVADAV